jgi:uncharacterized RmlC-like cupin family protein
MSKRVRWVAVFVLIAAAGAWVGAQEQPPANATQEFWIQRAAGDKAYVPPNKPHPKLSDLKAKYKGQSSWKVTVLKDGESQADYISMAQFIASEGDILYAPPYMLHTMANHGAGGACRIAIGGYNPEHFDPVAQ